MKSAAVFFALFATASAFNTGFKGTRAVTKKAPVVESAPASDAYPMFDTSSFKISGISGGGNKAPAGKKWTPPDFSDPKLQIERDPEFYAAAAKTRLAKKQVFVYEDGLTDLERKQRTSIPEFLTGSAKSQIDASAIAEVEGVDYFGLSADDFQLTMLSILGLFTLVGCLSGSIKL